MKKIGFIDPFMINPAVHCFNELVQRFSLSSTYHMPSKFGVKTLERHQENTQGYVIVGSLSHVTEPLEWHAPLAEFLVEELRKGKPVLGCCFGHQLLAHALGSLVDYATPEQEKYTGVREITICGDFWNFKQGEKFILPVSHKQVVKTLAPGLRSVGHGLENDIIIHEDLPLLTTQAHPEASSQFFSEDEGQMTTRHDGPLFMERFFEFFT